MPVTTIEGAVLDHVAHAVPRWQDVWDRYAVDFGAEWNSGGPGPGFAPAQLRFANGARVEVLMPNDTQVNDFLARFLAANGPGPHHLTFKVPDLEQAIEQVRATGIEPVGINQTDPEWMEAFLHPKLATGVVVQLAQQAIPWTSPAPDDYPVGRRQRREGGGPVPPAELQWVTHAVADLDAAADLFAGLLGGAVVAEGSGTDQRWTALAWDGPLGIRLVSPAGNDPATPLRQWIGSRPGRIHHLAVATAEPEGLPDVRPVETPLPGWAGDGADRWVIEPGDNGGLRLVLADR
jgi:catechol 2,3-dioxygenase-like lactoylglutathione lyase family enzyme